LKTNLAKKIVDSTPVTPKKLQDEKWLQHCIFVYLFAGMRMEKEATKGYTENWFFWLWCWNKLEPAVGIEPTACRLRID